MWVRSILIFSLYSLASNHMNSGIKFNPLQVCVEKLQDLQLALVISRLYESEFETACTYKKILQRHVLGQDKQVL